GEEGRDDAVKSLPGPVHATVLETTPLHQGLSRVDCHRGRRSRPDPADAAGPAPYLQAQACRRLGRRPPRHPRTGPMDTSGVRPTIDVVSDKAPAMRRPRVRMTVRGLMVAVAVVAIVLGVGLLKKRRDERLRRLAFYSALEHKFMARAQSIAPGEPSR